MNNISRSFEETWKSIRFVFECTPLLTIASALIVMAKSLVTLASLYILKQIIDATSTAVSQPSQGTELLVFWLILLAALVALVDVLLQLFEAFVTEQQGSVITNQVQSMVHAKSVRISIEHYDNPCYHDMLYLAQKEAPNRPIKILKDTIRIIDSSVSLFAITVLITVKLNWVAGLVLIVSSMPGAFFKYKDAKDFYMWVSNRTVTQRWVSYLNDLLTHSQYAEDVRVFGLGGLFSQRSKIMRAKLQWEKRKILLMRTKRELISATGEIAGLFGVLVFVSSEAISGVISLGEVVMFFGAFQRGQALLQTLSAGWSEVYQNSLFLKSLFDLLDTQERETLSACSIEVPYPISQKIEFHGVTFRYPSSGKDLLRDFSLTIKAGEHVALVGENGSGKSTIIKLLCGLYDVTNGRILVDGIDIRNIPVSSLRKTICVMPQRFNRYDLDVTENIWLGEVDEPARPSSIESAAQSAAIHDSILGLASGYSSQLGTRFAGGVELSQGQWQKIALARAFLRMKDSQLILLDEPASGLDGSSETKLFNNLRVEAAGRTMIVVSHRLSTIKDMDKIYLIQQGKLTEQGTHEELMRIGGCYAKLFELQAAAYR